jgi:hypothetical protein
MSTMPLAGVLKSIRLTTKANRITVPAFYGMVSDSSPIRHQSVYIYTDQHSYEPLRVSINVAAKSKKYATSILI